MRKAVGALKMSMRIEQNGYQFYQRIVPDRSLQVGYGLCSLLGGPDNGRRGGPVVAIRGNEHKASWQGWVAET